MQKSIARLAEASARVRLSEVVTEEDLNRACRLVEKYLKQVGMDPDAETFDADLVEVGTTTSQRETILTILAIVDDEMTGKLDSVPENIVVDRATDEGLNAQKVRDRIDHLVEERGELARQDGEVWPV